MKNINAKIGFSYIGGIYIGKNIKTDFHRHYAITIAISADGVFEVSDGRHADTLAACLLQPHVNRKFNGDGNVIFIHIDPSSEPGLKLRTKDTKIKTLNKYDYLLLIEQLMDWFVKEDDDQRFTEDFIHAITDKIIEIEKIEKINIDRRVQICMHAINMSKASSLKEIAEIACLSPTRISHLFKNETGISFKQFLLHSKLIRALKAIYLNQNLTNAAHSGGFSDQAHFTRTYLKTFGILPSLTVK